MTSQPRAPRAPLKCLVVLTLTASLLSLACGDEPGAATLDLGEDQPGGATTNALLLGSTAFIAPATNITLEHERMFFTGNALFNQGWVEAPASTEGRDGLGPVFNARSCGECHFRDGRGRPPLEGGEAFSGLLLRLGIPGGPPDGASLPEPTYGGQLQPFGVGNVPGEASPRVVYDSIPGRYDDGSPFALLVPTYLIESPAHGPLHDAVTVSPRVAPAMIGLGLLEAVSEERLLELSDPDDADGDGVSGRPNRVWDVERGDTVIGRFGWKAEQPSVRQQSAGAFNGDLGITSSLFPDEQCSAAQESCLDAVSGGTPELTDRLLDRVERYSQLLAVPAREDFGAADVLRGKAQFHSLGCGACHTESHRTSPDAPLEETRDQLIWPYTDLLLHDMGEALSDHGNSYAAEGNEWRTPPLWGLGRYPVVNGHDRLLHDGRARGVAEAIAWHGGEALSSMKAFMALSAGERDDLVSFVESL